MKRSIDWKFFGILVAAVVLLCGAIHATHVFQVRNVSKGLLLQAQEAERNKESEKAQKAYLQYLGYKPGDPDALASYSLLLASDPNVTNPEFRVRAIQSLQNAVTRAPLRTDIRKELATLLHDQGRSLLGVDEYKADGQRLISEALDFCKSLISDAPDDASLFLLRGACNEDLKEPAKAIEDYSKARDLDPTLIASYNRLALLLRLKQTKNDADLADRVMDAKQLRDGLVAKNPKVGVAYLSRARYRREFKIEGYGEDIATALELEPDNSEIILAGVEMAREKNDPAAERKLLVHGFEKHPEVSEFYRSLAFLDIREGKVDDGIETLKKGATALPKDLLIRWVLADILIQTGRNEDAAAEIQKLRDLGFLRELSDSLEGQLLFKQGKWSEAAKLLTASAPLLDSRRGIVAEQAKAAFIALAQCHERLGNPDQQLDAYKKAASIATPQNPSLTNQAEAGIALSLIALNRGDAAIQEFEKLIKRPDAPPVVMAAMVQQMIARTRRLPAEQRDWRQVEDLIGGIQKNQPNSADAVLLRAELLVAQEKVSAAREVLEKAKTDLPKVPSVWIALAVVASRQGLLQDVPKILDDASKELGDIAEIRTTAANYWGSIGGDAGKAGLETVQKDLDKYPKETQQRILSAVGVGYLQMLEDKLAEKAFRAVVEMSPLELEPHLVLFDIANRAGDSTAKNKEIEALRKIEGENGTYWRYCEAKVSLAKIEELSKDKTKKAERTAEISRGRKFVTETIERRPNWSKALIALATFDELEGQSQNALVNYIKAIDLGEREERAIIRTVQLLNKARRFDQADQLLRKIQQERPLVGRLGRLAADESSMNSDFGRALNLAEQSVAKDSTDPRDHLWLAQLRAANGQRASEAGRKAEADKFFTQAEQSFRRAIELNPTDTNSHWLLVRFLSLTKQTDVLQAELKYADKVLSKGGAASVRAAAANLAGDTDLAVAKYQEALQENPEDLIALRAISEIHLKRGKAKEAEVTLKTMAALGGQSPEEAKVAKRALALLLGSSTDYRRTVQALEMLKEDDETQALSVEDRRAKARILARIPNRPSRRQAIALLEGINAIQVPILDDQYVLAQLYEADGDWTGSKPLYQAILKAEPKNVAATTSYVRALIRKKEFDEARFWVRRLEENAPRIPSTLEIQARLLAATNRGAEAASVARSIIDLQPNQAIAVGALLEEIGEKNAAEAVFRQVAANPDKPTNPLLLAEFLGRQGRSSEALDIIEKAWATAPHDLTASVATVVLYNSPADEALCKRVGTLLDEAAKADPDEVQFQFGKANVFVLQRRYDEAEAIYRKTAEMSKENAASLNNLAWLLAIQNTKGAEALKAADEAIAVAGPRPQLLDTRALAYMVNKRYDLAIKDLEDAAAVDPTAEIYVHLARAYWSAERREEAAKAMKEAVSLGVQPEKIHPLEREAYQKLLSDLAARGDKF